MDIYRFINSPDVAQHCRNIGKTWNAFEMAVIIGRSHCTIAEKHKGWRELMADYPDMPTPENLHCESYPSLHEKIKETIVYEERALASFQKAEPDAVYRYMVRRHDEERHSEAVFVRLEKAFADARSNWERDEIPGITIYKNYLRDKDSRIEVWMDYDGNPYDLTVYGSSKECFDIPCPDDMIFFEWMFYIDIPIPFKRGDILTIRSPYGSKREQIVFVLDQTTREDRLEQRLQGKLFSDGSDMMGWGLAALDNGLLYLSEVNGYDSFVYYQGALKENNRLLHYVHLFLKEEIRLPELLTMQGRILMEHQLVNHFRMDTHDCYISEHQLAENRLTPEQEEEMEKTGGVMPWLVGKLSIHQVEFLVREFGGDQKSVQIGLGDGGGSYLGQCARIVHEENHYERIGDHKCNLARRDMARMFLAAYGYTEKGWRDAHESETDTDSR